MLSNRSSFKSLLHPSNENKNHNLPENINKNQQRAQPTSHLASTNGNICIINDDYSRLKVAELQEELSKLKKQMAQRQSFHHKQKAALLIKLQLVSSQNVEIKQRQNNLIKLNQTLELAISTTQKSQGHPLATRQIEQLQESLSDRNKMIKQSKRALEQCKRLMRNSQAEKYQLIQQKQRLIFDLNNRLKMIKNEKDQLLDGIRNDILGLPFKKEMVNMIIRSLGCFSHQQSQEQQDAFGESSNNNSSSQYLQSPISKRRGHGQLNNVCRQSKIMLDQSYSRFSGNSIINELNKRQIASEYSEQHQQADKLLCEVCKKVYVEQQFIMHLEQCNQIHHLHKKRSQLEKAIEELNMQQRKSVSQKKHHQNNNIGQRPNVLEQWGQNANRETSRSKINGKMNALNQKSRKQSNEEAKKMGNRSQLYHHYASNRLY